MFGQAESSTASTLYASVPNARTGTLTRNSAASLVRATRCVGTRFGGSKSPEALRALLGIIAMEQEEWDLRDTAYASLLEILGAPRDEMANRAEL